MSLEHWVSQLYPRWSCTKVLSVIWHFHKKNYNKTQLFPFEELNRSLAYQLESFKKVLLNAIDYQTALMIASLLDVNLILRKLSSTTLKTNYVTGKRLLNRRRLHAESTSFFSKPKFQPEKQNSYLDLVE